VLNYRNSLPVKVCLEIVLKLKTISRVFEDPELVRNSDSYIELVDPTDEHQLRLIHGQSGIPEELTTLCGGTLNVVYKTMVSGSSECK
jgi:hypothetical protein